MHLTYEISSVLFSTVLCITNSNPLLFVKCNPFAAGNSKIFVLEYLCFYTRILLIFLNTFALCRRIPLAFVFKIYVVFLGMIEGQKVMFHGEGDQEPDLEPGDVVIVLVEKEHPVYHR